MNDTAARRVSADPLATPAPPRVENRISVLVHKINARIGQIVNPMFNRHGLDLFSSRILVFLMERREMRVGELVDAMVLPQSTISHQLQRLEERGFVTRRRADEDNRAVAVALTERGWTVAAECNRVSAAVLEAMLADFAPAEVERLRGDLGAIFARLAAFELEPGERG